jgi:hypothetical protein
MKAVAYSQIEILLPFLLKFLANEYDDVSCAVFSFVSALQTIVSLRIFKLVFIIVCYTKLHCNFLV